MLCVLQFTCGISDSKKKTKHWDAHQLDTAKRKTSVIEKHAFCMQMMIIYEKTGKWAITKFSGREHSKTMCFLGLSDSFHVAFLLMS